MKSTNEKIILTLVLLVILILLIPSNVHAVRAGAPIVKRNEATSIEVGDLRFKSIIFRDYTDSPSRNFGLSGIIYNDTSSNVNYTAKAKFYDQEYNLLATNETTGTVKANDFGAYSGMCKKTDLEDGYSVDDIYYYEIIIESEVGTEIGIVAEENTYNDYTQTTDNEYSATNEYNTNSEIFSGYKTPSKKSQYAYYDYVIDEYNVDIIVNENNTFDITETITAYFNTSKHGIYRNIPIKNTVTRTDGTTTINSVSVSNVSVNNEYSTSIGNGYYKIQIGSASRTVTGSQTYVIKYTYSMGKDPLKDCDEFYFNIIGDEWETVIGNVNFNITMPKSFDTSKLGFSSGTTGSTKSNVTYSVLGNTITGTNNSILNANEAITIRLELEEGYFSSAGVSFDNKSKYLLIIPLVCLCISLLLWARFGKDDEVIETVEFYPPEGFNSLEIGFLYKGDATNKDVTSLLIYLANKGYIEIMDIEEESLFTSSKSFKIRKLKEYDGNDVNERLFLEGLFTKRKRHHYTNDEDTDGFDEVTASQLYDSFYITMRKILKNVNNVKNKSKIFETYTKSKSVSIIFMIIISLATIIGIPTLEYGNIGSLFTTIVLAAFYSPFYIVGFMKGIPLFFRIFWVGFTVFHSMAFFSQMPIAYALTLNKTFLVGFIFGIMCIIGMVLCLKAMQKRTKYGNEILGKIRGFKTFLETAKKDELESMVLQNPKYFYDILPFTYVLEVSDVWIKKFEYISMEEPDWYRSSTGRFDMHSFGSFMDSTMTSAERMMSSSPSSSSGGGGSSGGGSSGGGSGGGGGGSW